MEVGKGLSVAGRTPYWETAGLGSFLCAEILPGCAGESERCYRGSQVSTWLLLQMCL